jgi:hypothetical protein
MLLYWKKNLEKKNSLIADIKNYYLTPGVQPTTSQTNTNSVFRPKKFPLKHIKYTIFGRNIIRQSVGICRKKENFDKFLPLCVSGIIPWGWGWGCKFSFNLFLFCSGYDPGCL